MADAGMSGYHEAGTRSTMNTLEAFLLRTVPERVGTVPNGLTPGGIPLQTDRCKT